ncbi:MAG: isopentenyl-diphosphate Delta-isomerase [Flavobacteriales bacterium]|nr:isopentenyl-diphosphate Delta-isomerase [Flavobacteriales bacterium]
MKITTTNPGDKEMVILVNRLDEPTGTMEKMQAHVEGKLHRAFSAFIFNSKGELMMHRRALSKYHSPGLWTNTCCSHPRPGEKLDDAVRRRLMEELGFTCPVHHAFSFVYKKDVGHGLTEHELDHVFIGWYDGLVIPNPKEVDAVTFRNMSSVYNDIDARPEKFTEWFKICFPLVEKFMDREITRSLAI